MSKPHRMLTLRERLEIIDRNESGESVKSLVSAFGVGKTQIYDLLRRKEELQKFAEATPLDKKRMGKQDRDLNEKLILEVQTRPLLYDMNHEDYRNRFAVTSEWKAVAQIMDLPVKVVRRKWQNLKAMYSKSLTSLQLTGSETKFCFHDQLSFLENYMTETEGAVTYCSADDVTEVEEMDRKDIVQQLDNIDSPALPSTSFSSVSSPQAPISLKRKLDSSSLNQEVANYFKTKRDSGVDPTLEFLKGLVPEANQLSRKRRRMFFRGVTSLLFELLDEQDDELDEMPQCFYE